MSNIFYIMGVSGCGKSTIGKLLSKKLSIPFYDGDDYHPETNIAKMAAGNALNDADRFGWLERLNTLAKAHENGAVIACSSLKESYRVILANTIEDRVVWVYLSGTFDEITARIKKRKNHYMPSSLLQSQFAILEEPTKAITITISLSPEEIISKITADLKYKKP